MECRDNVCARRILGTQAIASAEYFHALELRALQCSHDIEVQRLTEGTRLLGTVEYGNVLYRIRNRVYQRARYKRTVQAYLDNADLLALAHQVVDRLVDRLADRTHSDDDALSIRCAIVIEQLVVRADLGIDLVHVLSHDRRQLVIELVACLACLEEDVRILCGTHLARMVRIQCIGTELIDRVHIDHFLQILIIPSLDLLDLVGSTETVKEVDERYPALDRSHMSNRSQIHDFLYGRLAEHSHTGLTAGIHIGVVAKDIQRMG